MDNYELEIDLFDMLKKMLRSWAVILLGVSAVGLLFLIGRTALKQETPQTGAEAVNVTESEEGALSQAERATIDNVLLEEMLLSHDTTYMQESILVNIDPMEAPQCHKYYYISTKGDVSAIISMLSSYITRGDYIDDISVAPYKDIKPEYIKELVSVTSQLSSSTGEDFKNLENGALLTVSVLSDSIENAERLANIVVSSLEKYDSENSTVIAVHELRYIDTFSSEGYISDIVEKRTATNNSIVARDAHIKETVGKFTDAQREYYYEKSNTEDVEEEAKAVLSWKDRISSFSFGSLSKRDLVIGAALGIIFVCGIWACVYIFCGKIHTADDIRHITGIQTIIEMGKESKWNSRKQLLATNLLIACRKANIHWVLLATTGALTTEERNLAADIKLLLSKENIESSIIEDLVENPSGLTDLADIGSVILFERLEGSKVKKLYEANRTLSQMDVKKIAAVVTE
ncbi:MAG: hypothetical protein K6E47_08205 [Lachnospiraceae bacterium]|nr:hypothetical protein [Lachnospiraceae bacterium]